MPSMRGGESYSSLHLRDVLTTFNYAWPLIYTTGMDYAGVIVVDCLVDVGERGRGDSREGPKW
jgi:hypothetical protein